MKQNGYYIGIDPGEHTGVAVWDAARQEFLQVEALPLHRAFELGGKTLRRGACGAWRCAKGVYVCLFYFARYRAGLSTRPWV